MRKKYTKCECCPYYAKEVISGRWECSRINTSYFYFNEYKRTEKIDLCIFNKNSGASAELKKEILELWISANKKGEQR